jgi:hypothetical protein
MFIHRLTCGFGLAVIDSALIHAMRKPMLACIDSHYYQGKAKRCKLVCITGVWCGIAGLGPTSIVLLGIQGGG